MKKILILGFLTVITVSLTFGQIMPEGEKKSDAVNSDIQTIKLAHDLADYGYENDSASALLQAAEILAQIPTQTAKYEAAKSGTSAKDAKKEHSLTPEELIKDAKELAKKDKTMLAWASDIEKSLKTRTRGATGGPLYAEELVYGNGGTTWYYWYFDANRLADIYVYPFNGADLDLYIEDENGNMIVYDSRNCLDAWCQFTPKWTGVFKVTIKNNSPWNTYFSITTN